MSEKLSVLVIDTNPIIKRIDLFGCAQRIVTVPNVISEIRDQGTRDYLATLPYRIEVEEPTDESLKMIRQLSVKTGDHNVLSKTDLEVMALTLDYHKRIYSSYPDFLPIKPLPNLGKIAYSYYKPKKTIQSSLSRHEEDNSNEKDEWISVKPKMNHRKKPVSETEEIDDEDWICEENFDEKKLLNFGFPENFTDTLESLDESNTKLGCMTSDFAMQNVLLHANLKLVSFDKMLIKEPSARVLWCTACQRVCRKKDIYFCPKCGHAQLHRIPVTLRDNGELEFHFNRNYRPYLKGAVHPIKKPQGGQHADNPIYCADQRIPDRRLPKTKKNVDLMATNGLLGNETDLIDAFVKCGMSATIDDGNVYPLNDVQSRGFTRGIRADGQIPIEPWRRVNGYHGLKPTKGNPNVPKKYGKK